MSAAEKRTPDREPVAASGPTNVWGGRFTSTMDARLEAFNASVTFDVRMIKEDIRGSIAHVRMLGAQGIVSAEEAAAIEAGLWHVWDEVEAGTLQFTIADEDVHTGVERRLRELIGRDAGRLHTGRSRNDQVINDVRLWTKGALLSLIGGTIELATALLDVAAANDDYVMPGYTHLQRAQPVLLSHHLLAYVAMLTRDIDRLKDAHRRTDVMALGSGALAGVTYAINRELTARDLGFGAISTNSMDAVSDRDFILDTMYACSLIAAHVSRLSEEVILWTSAEFRFMELADAFSTGSSIMPQKKNADIAELARGKTGRVYGHLFGLLTVLKGLPLTFNKDFQEDKEALFDTVDTTLAVLDVYPPMIRTARFNRERMAGAAIADFSLATDAADLLAKHGVPFREAHEVIGKLVRQCIERDITFAELSDDDWGAAHPVFAANRPPMTAEESIAARDIPGGTAPDQVRVARLDAATQIEAARAWLSEREAAYASVMRRPGNGLA